MNFESELPLKKKKKRELVFFSTCFTKLVKQAAFLSLKREKRPTFYFDVQNFWKQKTIMCKIIKTQD